MGQETSIYPQHSLPTATLHVLPGLLATMAFVAIKPQATGTGYPPLFAFVRAILLIDIP